MNEKGENKKEENENDESERYEYCWDGCYDKETDWIVETTILEVEGYEKFVYCPKCHKTWSLDYSGKTTMLGPKHCQHKEREIGNPMKLTGEGCSNEPQYKCEAQNWCNGDWVCGEHWVEHDWHDWSCVICSQEYAVYGN